MREGADDCAASYVYHHLGILETNKLRDKSSSELTPAAAVDLCIDIMHQQQ